MVATSRKRVLFVADSLNSAPKFQQVLSALGVDVTAVSSTQMRSAIATKGTFDLVVCETRGNVNEELASIEQVVLEYGSIPLLAIVSDQHLVHLRLPARIRCDFVTTQATLEECSLRVRTLLASDDTPAAGDVIVFDAMTINLATYQVTVAGEPIDLTYLEYALLSFLVTHSGRTYSRDALLRHVWGFDYYGGSRTVDVHVRRVRAKLGPELAQHLETVRGVGYLWD